MQLFVPEELFLLVEVFFAEVAHLVGRFAVATLEVTNEQGDDVPLDVATFHRQPHREDSAGTRHHEHVASVADELHLQVTAVSYAE